MFSVNTVKLSSKIQALLFKKFCYSLLLRAVTSRVDHFMTYRFKLTSIDQNTSCFA